MKAYIITMERSPVSISGAGKLAESIRKYAPKVEPIVWAAVTPEDSRFDQYKDLWNYPWTSPETCPISKIVKTPYRTSTPKGHVACSVSHYLLWEKAARSDKPIMVLEHDAIFVQPFKLYKHEIENWNAIGINNPIGATRKSGEYNAQTQKTAAANLYADPIVSVPWVDNQKSIPQGLAGNSAYIITPKGGKILLELIDKYGMWPNDALMCKQLMDGLGQTHTYYTQVQRLGSTTT